MLLRSVNILIIWCSENLTAYYQVLAASRPFHSCAGPVFNKPLDARNVWASRLPWWGDCWHGDQEATANEAVGTLK